MQIKYFKTKKKSILKYLEQKNAKLEQCKIKQTQTLVVFKQSSLTDVDLCENL